MSTKYIYFFLYIYKKYSSAGKSVRVVMQDEFYYVTEE